MALTYAELDLSHAAQIQEFSCTEPSFAEYLKTQAFTDKKRNLNTIVVAFDGHDLAGYFSYCSSSLLKSELSKADARGLPSYPLPAILLTRLAVDKNHTGTGIGSDLLIEFFNVVHRLNENPYSPAARIVFLDLYKPDLMAFYKRLGFKATQSGKRMYINMKSIAGCL